MRIRFTKMQGAGNDFVMLDETRGSLGLTRAQYRFLADRHFGVGADQILTVRPPPKEAGDDIDFEYVIHNADGGEVEQCGNGARCFVRFVHDAGLTRKAEIRVITQAGLITPRLEPSGEVSVDMGAPIFEPARVPFDPTGLTARDEGVQPIWPIEIAGCAEGAVSMAVLSMGNPHAVQIVDDVARAPVEVEGPLIEAHTRFPKRVNAGFMQILDRHAIRLRVYERGAGETLACGTGACAAVVAGVRRGRLDSPVRVATRGGDLTITWAGADNPNSPNSPNSAQFPHAPHYPYPPVLMTGPAVTVFEGELDTESLPQSQR